MNCELNTRAVALSGSPLQPRLLRSPRGVHDWSRPCRSLLHYFTRELVYRIQGRHVKVFRQCCGEGGEDFAVIGREAVKHR